MKRIFYLFPALALMAGALLTGCNNDDENPTPVADCASQTFPTPNGTSSVVFKNFSTDSDGDGIIDVNASAGDYLSIAVEVTKATSGARPQKLRVYQTDCKNAKGELVSFAGQPKTEDGGKTIDLTNTDEPQVRTLLYTVPSGYGTLYLNFEVDESGDKFVYKRIKLNISGSGVIDSWSGIQLGGNTNALASRMSSATGYTFKACETAANIQYIDITYAVSTTNSNSYLASNPARFQTPLSLNATTVDCGDEQDLATNGGTATYFKKNTAINFDNATDTELSALTVANTDPQYAQVAAVGDVFEFLNSNGRKGLIKVTNVASLNDPAGSITVSVKVQR